MPGLLIKDLPEELHERLRARAGAHHRSMSREVVAILEEVLADRAGPPALEVLDRLRVRGARPLTQDLLDDARRTGRP